MRQIISKPDIKVNIFAKCYDQSQLSKLVRFKNRIVEYLAKKFNSRSFWEKYYTLGPLKWADEKENLIAYEGFEVVGQILTGNYGSTGEVTHAALGSSTTAPATSDTQLGTEVYRNAMFSGTASGNITYLTAVYTELETSGTYQEFGNFIDATGTANSGKLWSHVLTGGWVKTTSDVLVVDQKYTFTSS